MASNPPGSCCTVGVKHDGEPTGTLFKLDGSIETYVAEPKGKTVHKDTAILYLADAIGIWQNAQLIADQYAANGYYTIIPDIFNGDPLTLNMKPDFDIMGWLTKGTDGNNPHTYNVVDPIVEKAIKYLKEEKGFKKIGAVGYCFGGKYVIRFLEKGRGVDVGFVAHPSFADESEVAAISGPLSIAAAETDQIFPAEKRQKTESILVETKQPYQINLFSGVSHGFAVRCDLDVKVQKFAKESAFLQAVAWFDEYLI